MESVALKVQSRKETGKAASNLRKQGFIPAVLYGHGSENINISIPYNDFVKVFEKARESSFVDLAIDDKEAVKVLIHDYQTEPVSGRFTHVDFYKIRMDQKIHVKIGLKFNNEAPAEKGLGGTLLTNLEEIEAKCLPKDLIGHIDVDLSVLKTFDDSIHVKDLNIPDTIEIMAQPDDVVAKVSPPRTEEELKALEEKPEGDVSQVEVEGEKKEGEEEGTEDKKADESKDKAEEEKKEEKK